MEEGREKEREGGRKGKEKEVRCLIHKTIF
jgi:hypothetical protein